MCFEDHWATICDQQWNEEDAEVACRQLGHSGGNVNIIPAWLLKIINIAARRKVVE